MKRLKILFLMMCVGAVGATAQDVTEVQKFEGEASLGFTCPVGGFHGGGKHIGPEFGLELRYNVPQTKWDVGAALNVTTAVHRFHPDYSEWISDQSNRTISFLAVGDYNFRQGRKVNPYVGAGIGVGSCEPINDVEYDAGAKAAFVFRPRVGVELFRHLRVGVHATVVTRSGYSNIGFTIGGVIGGRPKKRP